MTDTDQVDKVRTILEKGMGFEKCRKCECMRAMLLNMRSSSSSKKDTLIDDINKWIMELEPVEYNCFGCRYCYPAEAMNISDEAFQGLIQKESLICVDKEPVWPPEPGEYYIYQGSGDCHVAISTLGSVELAEKIADVRPEGVCIAGKTETENIGIEKVVRNIITNAGIRYLILTGNDPEGHYSGRTFLTLWQNGVDDNMRVIGSPGKHPVLKNLTKEIVDAFRKQVQVVDLVGCEDLKVITGKIKDINNSQTPSCKCGESLINVPGVPAVRAVPMKKIEMDRSGYFVIIPQFDKGLIIVEHYSYDNRLLRVIKGENAKDLYLTIIENKWVTLLSHAAYLGRELGKAESSLWTGTKYVQGGA